MSDPSAPPPWDPDAPAADPAPIDAPRTPALDEDGRRVWGAGAAVLALMTTFGVSVFLGVPAVLIGEDSSSAKVAGNVVSSILQNVAFVAVPLLILTLLAVGSLRRRDFGLELPSRRWLMIGLIAAGFVAYLVLAAGLGALLGVGDQKDDLPEKLGAKDSLGAGIIIALCVTILAPIGEEFLLRGVVYPGLRNSLRRVSPLWVAIVVAALIDGLIFGGLHAAGSKAIFLPILALFGAVLCLLYQATGSLYAPIVLHATNNTMAITASLGWRFTSGVLLWVVSIATLAGIAAAVRALERRRAPDDRTVDPPRGDDHRSVATATG